MNDLTGKVAIVTGGTGALGRTIVNKLASEGAKVYVPALTLEEFNSVFDNSQSNNDESFSLKKIFSFVCDAVDDEAVTEFVRSVAALENGKLDILVNTVGGIHPNTDVSEMNTELFDKMFSLNFKSAFYFTREALKVMKVNRYGRIFSIGAIAAYETTPGKLAYSISKGAVISLMNTVSEETKDIDVRANTIVPSILDTPANREWGSEDDIKKWVQPEDIAEIISSMCRGSYKSVRGSTIKVLGNY